MFLLPSDRKIESQRASSPGSKTTRHRLQYYNDPCSAWGRPLQLIQTLMDRLLWTWTKVGKMHGLMHPHQDCWSTTATSCHATELPRLFSIDERFQFHAWRSACGRKMKEACLFSGTMSFWQSSASRLMLAPWPTMSAEPFRKSRQRIKLSATPARSVGSLRKLLSADFYRSLVDLGLQLLWRIAGCFLPKVSVQKCWNLWHSTWHWNILKHGSKNKSTSLWATANLKAKPRTASPAAASMPASLVNPAAAAAAPAAQRGSPTPAAPGPCGAGSRQLPGPGLGKCNGIRFSGPQNAESQRTNHHPARQLDAV